MFELSRRELLAAFGAAGLLPEQIHSAVRAIKSLDQGDSHSPQFFNPHEYATLRRLADFIIPAEEDSLGAIDAGAAEFADYICAQSPDQGKFFRDGLGWLDDEIRRLGGASFVAAAREQQREEDFVESLRHR